jgi:hypothetical protein
MPAPRSLGWWVAFERALSTGGKRADLQTAIERCKATGATWIAMRAGAGGNDDAALTEESVVTLDEAGLDVFIWIFDYTGRSGPELEDYRRWFKTGRVKGAILNAEYEYAKSSAHEALALVQSVRDIGYDFVAHAPPDYLGARGGEPWDSLDDACDQIMPQVYSFEHDDRGHVFHLDRVLALYKARGIDLAKVSPIGCSYRPKTRGYRVDQATGKSVPVPTPPMANEADVVARDVLAFMDHPHVASCAAPSLYTLDAITWINGAGDRVLPALTERARRKTTEPPAMPDGGVQPGSVGAATPMGWEARADWDNRDTPVPGES